MSAHVQNSTDSSSLQVQYLTLWADDQMSQYPPPPQPGQQHYSPLYQPPAVAQILEGSQQEQLQYGPALNPPLLPKVDGALANASHSAIQSPANNVDQRVDPPLQSESQPAPKTNRLRKACDSCSIRKVKCDESGPPCRACAALDIPCTFDRPSRRRGPPNRHAEAIKKRRLESPTLSGTSAPSSPTNAAHALATLSSYPQLSAESICSLDIIDLFINDFFTYIHPLCPFPHEPTFRQDFMQRKDFSDRRFLALLASMIAILVASFPRKPRQHLKSQQKDKLFPTHMSLINRCQQVCAAARGTGFLDKEDLNVYDAMTSYFLALTGAYTFHWRQCRLYLGECMTLIRSLELHKTREQRALRQAGAGVQSGYNRARFENAVEPPVDYVAEEMGKRLWWTVFVGVRTMQQMGNTLGEVVILPPTKSEPHPPLPLEVDDQCIYSTHIAQQPPGLVPILTGFNANVRVFASYNSLVTMEMAYGIDEVFDWERQKRVVDQSLRTCKSVLDGLPPELSVWPGGGQMRHQAQPGQPFYGPGSQYVGSGDPGFFPTYSTESSQQERRSVQCEIQKANIYASHLCTRSYIVEKYWNLLEAHKKMKAQDVAGGSPGVMASGLDGMLNQPPTSNPDRMDQEMMAEKDNICKDLLVVLSSISQVHMEPSAESLTGKIRSIAATLLDQTTTGKGSLALQAEQYLKSFVEILIKLERTTSAVADGEQAGDEETDLKHWADLREYQLKLAESEAGSIFGLQ